MQVIKNLLFMPLFAVAFFCCKNQPAGSENKSAAETNAETLAIVADTLPGFKGADRASYRQLTALSGEFEYQNYRVNVMDLAPKAGQRIIVFFKADSTRFTVPEMANAFFFGGIYRDRLFINVGTGPDGREMLMFDLKTRKLRLRTQFVGEPEIMPNGKLWYMRPALEEEITKMPECPEKAEWEKNGLRVGYGRVCNYDLTEDAEIKKNEWRCVAMQ